MCGLAQDSETALKQAYLKSLEGQERMEKMIKEMGLKKAEK